MTNSPRSSATVQPLAVLESLEGAPDARGVLLMSV